MTQLKKTVRPMERIPRGYGIAYYDVDWMVYVAYLWPMNHLVHWWRLFYSRFQHVRSPEQIGYEAGFSAGQHKGWLCGLEDGIRASRGESRK